MNAKPATGKPAAPKPAAAKPATDWNGATVRTWLESRLAASRLDQAVAQRGGRAEQDDCDKASAEEMVCTLLLKTTTSTDDQKAFAADLRALLDRDEYSWRGIYDDTRFERHVRSYIHKLAKMTKTNEGFDRLARYQ